MSPVEFWKGNCAALPAGFGTGGRRGPSAGNFLSEHVSCVFHTVGTSWGGRFAPGILPGSGQLPSAVLGAGRSEDASPMSSPLPFPGHRGLGPL